MVMSKEMVKEMNIEPIARLISYKVIGLAQIMGVIPLYAIQALKHAGIKLGTLSK